MGREVRMVPPGFEHPKDARGRYIPLLPGDPNEAIAKWDEGARRWELGETDDWEGGWKPRDPDKHSGTYAEWAGERPSPDDYMPLFAPGTATHFMMYEDTSEGTPISPGFATPEELARWLSENGASAFGSMTASYDDWLATIRRGSAFGMAIEGGRMMSGVEALNNPTRKAAYGHIT